MSHLVVLDRSVRVVFHSVLIGSLYLLFAGHNQPGGGFVGGLVAGAAVAMRYVAGGIDEVRSLIRFAPWTVLGAGLVAAVVTAISPLLFGGQVLEAGGVAWSLPLLGKVKLSTTLAFDVGVYLLVIGLVLMVFEAFGDDPPTDEELGSMSIVLAATAAVLFGIGTYLVLQHTLTRIIIGLALISHGGNVLLMASGRHGSPPLIGSGDADGFSDPLAQAMALTAIVITFGVSAFLLALAYRSWIINRDDEVQDDVGDRAIARHGHPDKEVIDEESWLEDPEEVAPS